MMDRYDDLRIGGRIASDMSREFVDIFHQLRLICGIGRTADALAFGDIDASHLALERSQQQSIISDQIEAGPV